MAVPEDLGPLTVPVCAHYVAVLVPMRSEPPAARTKIFLADFFHRAVRHRVAPLEHEIVAVEPDPVQLGAPCYERVAQLREVGNSVGAQLFVRLIMAFPRYPEAFEARRNHLGLAKRSEKFRHL